MKRRLHRTLAEAAGTFTLVTFGAGASMVAHRTHAFGHSGVALTFGLVVMFVVASSGHIGGAHINPAVTVGLWSVRRFPSADVVPYVIAQCIGAVAAAALLGWLLGPVVDYGATTPSLPLAQSFVVELGISGVLGFVILAVATDQRSPPSTAPFAIGAVVFAGALVAGPFTGGSFNPARSLGPAVVGNEWTAHWLYWLAPIAGVVLGMKLYEVLREPTAAVPNEGPLGVEGPIKGGACCANGWQSFAPALSPRGRAARVWVCVHFTVAGHAPTREDPDSRFAPAG